MPDAKGSASKDSTTKEVAQAYRDFAPYLTLGIQLAGAVVLFFFLGFWVDGKLGTTPTFSLVGVALGMIGGFIKFFRSVSAMSEQQNSKQAADKREH